MCRDTHAVVGPERWRPTRSAGTGRGPGDGHAVTVQRREGEAAIAAIAVPHGPPPAKPILFHRLYAALRPGGVLVVGDALQPATPALGERYWQLTAEECARQGMVETPAYAAYRSRHSQPSR